MLSNILEQEIKATPFNSSGPIKQNYYLFGQQLDSDKLKSV